MVFNITHRRHYYAFRNIAHFLYGARYLSKMIRMVYRTVYLDCMASIKEKSQNDPRNSWNEGETSFSINQHIISALTPSFLYYFFLKLHDNLKITYEVASIKVFSLSRTCFLHDVQLSLFYLPYLRWYKRNKRISNVSYFVTASWLCHTNNSQNVFLICSTIFCKAKPLWGITNPNALSVPQLCHEYDPQSAPTGFASG